MLTRVYGTAFFSRAELSEHLERIAIAARDAGTTVTVDAEDHRTTDAALRMATALRERFGAVGSVVQAALRRTEADVREMAAPGVRENPQWAAGRDVDNGQ